MGHHTHQAAQDTPEPLWEFVQARWKQLLEVYEAFREKVPILEIDHATKKVLAYPLAEFLAQLDPAERAELAADFNAVRAGTKLLVVVSDAAEQSRVCFAIERT